MRRLLVCFALLPLLSLACYRPPATTAPAAQAPVARVYTREEFKALVLGKTEAEVIETVGRPDETNEGVTSHGWIYKRRTKDPVTGKTDAVASIFFLKGKVESAMFGG
jgi:hypothetical protein